MLPRKRDSIIKFLRMEDSFTSSKTVTLRTSRENSVLTTFAEELKVNYISNLRSQDENNKGEVEAKTDLTLPFAELKVIEVGPYYD